MSEIVLVKPDDTAMRSEMAPVLTAAQELEVTNKISHADGQSLLAGVSRMGKRVVELFAEPKKAAHKAHRAVCEAEGKLLNPLKEARNLISRKCGEYEAEQRRIAEKKRRELEAQARKQEEDRRLAEAIAAEEAGDTATAEAILEEPPPPAPVISVEPEVAKVDGVSSQTRWRAEVTDKVALIKHVAAHPEWATLLDPNMPNLNQMARGAREGLQIPGVRAVSETTKMVRETG